MKLTRRKWLATMLGGFAALVGIVVFIGCYCSAPVDDESGSWVDDLRSIRGPGDALDFVTGKLARRRHELRQLLRALNAEVAVTNERLQSLQMRKAGNWPMFGGTSQRNMANPKASNIPADWSVAPNKLRNIRWTADLGSQSHGAPVIADGKVFVGTNNGQPRDPDVKGMKAVLMCFNEADGKFLWQAVHEVPLSNLQSMTANYGLWSTPCVDGDRHYYLTPACKAICADNKTGKILWDLDFMKKLKVVPMYLGNCSPLIVDDLVMLVTGNGADDEGKIASPEAPSFVALHKDTCKIAWQNNLPGKNIIEGQWSNPAVAIVNGKKQVIFPGGDCWLYSFEPATGALIWKCNCYPLRDQAKARDETSPYFVGTPVIHDGRCFIGMGVAPADHPARPRFSYMLCLDVGGKGDVSPKNFDAGDPVNKGSSLVWSFGGAVDPPPKKGRRSHFGCTVSTAAIHDGLVFIAEEVGYLHCLDARTGKRYWIDDVKAGVWGSAFYADGKVFLGTEAGDVIVYKHGKELQRIAEIDMEDPIHSTPVIANGVVYVATGTKLYAIAEPKWVVKDAAVDAGPLRVQIRDTDPVPVPDLRLDPPAPTEGKLPESQPPSQ